MIFVVRIHVQNGNLPLPLNQLLLDIGIETGPLPHVNMHVSLSQKLNCSCYRALLITVRCFYTNPLMMAALYRTVNVTHKAALENYPTASKLTNHIYIFSFSTQLHHVR